jgi:CDP-ribitol ribitolphosphotransferase / teichoic acid ribitol-phosphate polymerase
MKAVLFCANPYAFGILGPLYEELKQQGHETLWYVPAKIISSFPFKEAPTTTSIKSIYDFKADAIFVPGNEVPHYLRGVKVQVFHGLAGEKQGHFRIRNYFDLYLTQGPYFTGPFQEFAKKHRDFDVTETGWCKLDTLYHHHEEYKIVRDELLRESGKKHLVLYAPTFSPSLTSATSAQKTILEIADTEDVHVIVKFHDLMDTAVIDLYKKAAEARTNFSVSEEKNILKPMIMADLMISDTSSVVYEFILLNKPVITINSTSKTINWCNLSTPDVLRSTLVNELKEDNFKANRINTINAYHPYTDGKSSARMIAAVESYIQQYGVPERRKLNLYRRFKINRMFGKEPGH